jgi:hypothetical protein
LSVNLAQFVGKAGADFFENLGLSFDNHQSVFQNLNNRMQSYVERSREVIRNLCG